ncbi:hypothetical protein R1flu_019914 [Riccia fluitans]|uniref:HAD-IB family hydrolase n=1 Tax=Riccia fluitans TaxID=41844 RepID=A0ABD1ZM68_9MARC
MYTDINDSSHCSRLELRISKELTKCRLQSDNRRYSLVRVCGKFPMILSVKIKGRLASRCCCIDETFPSNDTSAKDFIGQIIVEQSVDPSFATEARTGLVKAAFFDIDGTITRTNVVLAYFAIRMSELSFLRRLFWVPCFAVLCIFYVLVDIFDRSVFNRIFYSNHYRGRSTDSKKSIAALVYEEYYKPRIFPGALEHIKELKRLGYRIVLVTGALDFQIAPLARELEADFVYAAELVEDNGRFTGKLNGMATSNSEKAERLLDYAERFGVSLEDSMAFGDSIADLPMLEMVGRPHAVNPDARLLAIALQRKWTVLSWFLQSQKASTYAEPLPS